MTDKAWLKEIRKFQAELTQIILSQLNDAEKKQLEKKLRLQLRDNLGLIFVREHTVKAYFKLMRSKTKAKTPKRIVRIPVYRPPSSAYQLQPWN